MTDDRFASFSTQPLGVAVVAASFGTSRILHLGILPSGPAREAQSLPQPDPHCYDYRNPTDHRR